MMCNGTRCISEEKERTTPTTEIFRRLQRFFVCLCWVSQRAEVKCPALILKIWSSARGFGHIAEEVLLREASGFKLKPILVNGA